MNHDLARAAAAEVAFPEPVVEHRERTGFKVVRGESEAERARRKRLSRKESNLARSGNFGRRLLDVDRGTTCHCGREIEDGQLVITWDGGVEHAACRVLRTAPCE